MARFRQINTNFWYMPKSIGDFSAEERYLYLYLITNPHTNLCGCYEISTKQIAHETGLKLALVQKSLTCLERVHMVIAYHPKTKELLLENWLWNNWTNSPKWIVRVQREIQHVKYDGFRIFLRAKCYELQHVYTPKTRSGVRPNFRTPPCRL